MMLALGMFLFELRTAPYSEMRRNQAWRHPKQNRVGQRPARQFVGPDDDTITLSGELRPEITGGRITLDVVRAMAATGKGWPLVEGNGRMYGLWVIEKIEETSSDFFRDGTPRKISFTIDLARVDESRVELLGDVIGIVRDRL
ncbi:phage tail protein [Alloalcanivorax xenomutans]|uniref:phage tail protein n=1 Tax=Alloalcanivorax xenomutans TaxID=1094342 RepID=UPI003BAAC9AF